MDPPDESLAGQGMTNLASYVGRRETQADVADPQRMAGLGALLDHGGAPWRPGVLPPLGHWLLFPPQARQSALGADGHPRRDEASLLPPVALPRRMWAGSRVEFIGDIALGTPLVRTSTLTAITPRSGRSGEMIFATLRHEIAPDDGEMAIVEEQDIVYREAVAPSGTVAPSTAEPTGLTGIVRRIAPDPVMLFRYSALTFNAHRIHYDSDFCRDVEGYPGLVVHGPLTATLLADHALGQKPHASVRTFSFRGIAPLFVGETIALDHVVTDGGIDLKAFGPNGLAMTARLEFVED